MDIKILENLLQVTIDRGNLRNHHHQVIQKKIMVDLGLFKSGKVERPMMSLIARAPSTVSSSASESPGKKS